MQLPTAQIEDGAIVQLPIAQIEEGTSLGAETVKAGNGVIVKSREWRNCAIADCTI